MAFTYSISVEIAVISSVSLIQNPCKQSVINLIAKIYIAYIYTQYIKQYLL